jgi:hypothetical protein
MEWETKRWVGWLVKVVAGIMDLGILRVTSRPKLRHVFLLCASPLSPLGYQAVQADLGNLSYPHRSSFINSLAYLVILRT